MSSVSLDDIATALGLSRSQATRKANTDSWPFEIEVLSTGNRRRIYPVRSLPKDIRQAILDHLSQQAAGAPLPAPVTPAGTLPGPTRPAGVPSTRVEIVGDTTQLTNNQRAIMDARCAVLAWVDQLAQVAGGITAARRQAEKLAKAGKLPDEIARLLPLANARSGKAGKRSVCMRTLVYWDGLREAAGGQAAALAPKATGPDMSVPAWAPALMTLFAQPTKRPLSDVVADLAKPGALPMGVEPPSYHQARRFLAKVGTVDRNRGRMGARELKSIRPFHRRDVSDLRPLDVVQADGHTLDQEVAHPRHHRPFRPEITTIVDLATRMIVGWSASLAENALGVTDAMVYMATKWGIPAVWYVDNGSGFNNQLMDDAHVGVLARLGMTKINRAPYNAQAGGYVERVQQTVWVKGAKQSPTYVGKDMDREARQKVYKLTRADIARVGRSRHLMTWEEFLAWAEAQVRAYNTKPHSGLPRITDPQTGRRRHMTPMEAWDKALAEGFEPILLSPTEAADITRPYEVRKVRRCTVSVLGATYWSADLEPYHDEEVLVGYDVHNAGQVYVRTLDGRLICTAGFEPTRSAVPRSVLERGYEARAKGRERRLMAHLSEVRAELNPNVIEGRAAPLSRAEIPQAQILELTAEPAPVPEPATTIPQSPEGRYARWRDIDGEIAAGIAVSDDDRRWHATYPRSAEWRAQDELHRSFGADSAAG